MKKSIFLGLILVSASILSGCKIDVVNGRVPADNMEAAQAYMGTYKGSFEGEAAELNLSMRENGFVDLSVSNASGPIFSECNASIGKLNSIRVAPESKMLLNANFDFTANACKIDGTEVELRFNQLGDINLFIAKESRTVYESWNCGSEPCIGRLKTIVYSWLSGSFSRR